MTRTMDVVCVNRYYGWYNLSGDLDAACYALNMELDFWEKQEQTGDDYRIRRGCGCGYPRSVPEMFSEEFQKEYYRRQNAEFDKRSFFIGEQVWNFADFATIQGCMRADGNKKVSLPETGGRRWRHTILRSAGDRSRILSTNK